MNLSTSALPHGISAIFSTWTTGTAANALRAGSRLTGESLRRIPHARRMHQAALASTPPPPVTQHDPPIPVNVGRGRRRRAIGGLVVREGLDDPGYLLEKRIESLQLAATKEEASVSSLFFTEDELKLFYKDLMAVPQQTVPLPTGDAELMQQEATDESEVSELSEEAQELEDAEALREAETRLMQTHPDISPQSITQTQADLIQPEMQMYWRVLLHTQAIVSHIEELRGLVIRGSDSEGRPVPGPSNISVPISVLSLKEFGAIIRASRKAQDEQAALLSLDLMKRSGMPIPEPLVTCSLATLSSAGNVKASEALITNFISSPTEYQRHLHIKAHLRASPPNTIPTTALDVLHAYEEKGLIPPMKSYTACILYLVYSASAIARAQAWDIFSHMRYVAHPNPDVWLYTVMIQACSSPISTSRSSDPEKALDLWTEMTIDKKFEPTVMAYNAVILACARSGEMMFVNEAFRLAKQMLDAHRDAMGVSAFRPDKKTFCALLEGAKRIGDLGRARWILAEMVKGGTTGMSVEGGEEILIDEQAMLHLFQSYASYRVPFNREATTVVQEGNAAEETKNTLSTETSISLAEVDTAADETEGSDNTIAPVSDSLPSFSQIPPQTDEEVLSEATFLFRRILRDTGVLPMSPDEQHQRREYSSHLADKFSNVRITPRLVDSYIAVFYRHGSLEQSEQLFWKLFDQLGLRKTARIYAEALEACSYRRKKTNQVVSARFSNDVWQKWKEMEDSGQDVKGALSARLIEKAYISRVRTLVFNGELDEAVNLVYSFVQRYPPSSVRTPSEKPYFRSTRTTLVGARPLVRSTSEADVPDDNVPPLMTSQDLELLHHRLVVCRRMKDVGYINWVGKAYEWMLRVRRDEGFRMQPVQDL